MDINVRTSGQHCWPIDGRWSELPSTLARTARQFSMVLN
jgi:hypothetical protein